MAIFGPLMMRFIIKDSDTFDLILNQSSLEGAIWGHRGALNFKFIAILTHTVYRSGITHLVIANILQISTAMIVTVPT